MKLKGNNVLFFALELISGVTVYFLTNAYGDWGLLGLILFFIGLVLTRNVADEREIGLLYKVSALEASFMGAVMAIMYFKFPGYNWFHGFVVFGLVIRGILGLIYFLKE